MDASVKKVYDDLIAKIKPEVLAGLTEHQRRLLDFEIIQNIYGGGGGLPYKLSLNTFKKKPIITAPRYMDAAALRAAEVQKRQKIVDFHRKAANSEYLAAAFNTDPNSAWVADMLASHKQHAASHDAYIRAANAGVFDADFERRAKKPEGFDAKGQPVAALMQLYRNLRGTGAFNAQGDFVGRVNGRGPNDGPWHSTAIRKLAGTGLIEGNERTGYALIPRETLKKIDPYFKDYQATLDAVAPRLGQAELRAQIGKYISLKGLKNIAKSNNLPGALEELRNFFADNKYELRDHANEFGVGARSVGLDSMNHVRNVQRAIQVAQDRRRYGDVVKAWMDAHPDTRLTAEQVQQQLKAKEAVPFEYDQRIMDAINFANEENGDNNLAASMFTSPQHMREFGRKRCYDGSSGEHYHEEYRDRIRKGDTLLVNVGPDITAELRLRIGNVFDADAGGKKPVVQSVDRIQVRGPANKDLSAYDEATQKAVKRRLDLISQDLIGTDAPTDRSFSSKNIELEEPPDVPDDGPEVENRAMQRLFKGGFVEYDFDAEEEKLVHIGQEQKGSLGLYNRLVQQAVDDGVPSAQAAGFVNKVMQRIGNVGTGGQGNAAGKAHKAEDRLAAIKNMLKNRPI